MTPIVLQVTGLEKAFGGIRAVDDVSFAVAAGELVALIGPNGAGKTTCFNLVNGQLVPDAGSVSLAGSRIDGAPAHAIARLGVGRTFQVAATFASMTVRENVRLARLAHAGRTGRLLRLPTAEDDAGVDALLARVGCADLADMHEPPAGLATRSRAALMQVAADLARRDGIAVLFTEHDMDVVFGFADRVIVLDRGKIIAEGPPDAVRADPRVQAVYLGEDEIV
jgi:branched-chain amino acid transport system ATP-binding protein